jgi:hypothetical protein
MDHLLVFGCRALSQLCSNTAEGCTALHIRIVAAYGSHSTLRCAAVHLPLQLRTRRLGLIPSKLQHPPTNPMTSLCVRLLHVPAAAAHPSHCVSLLLPLTTAAAADRGLDLPDPTTAAPAPPEASSSSTQGDPYASEQYYRPPPPYAHGGPSTDRPGGSYSSGQQQQQQYFPGGTKPGAYSSSSSYHPGGFDSRGHPQQHASWGAPPGPPSVTVSNLPLEADRQEVAAAFRKGMNVQVRAQRGSSGHGT